ncbi:MAG TPA: hypothetical protein VI753_01015 [Anaerolineales bacterium]|nr:hypothetical protein [Anaerolineales bacterium]
MDRLSSILSQRFPALASRDFVLFLVGQFISVFLANGVSFLFVIWALIMARTRYKVQHEAEICKSLRTELGRAGRGPDRQAGFIDFHWRLASDQSTCTPCAGLT